MIKLNKKNSLAFAITFAVAGILCLIFSKTSETFKFLSCVFFGAAFFMFGKFTKFKYFSNLINLDKNLDIMLKDIEINGEYSEYYGFSKAKKKEIERKFIKKNKNAYIYFYVFAGAIFICSIFMLF